MWRMYTVPSQFGIPRPEIELLGYMGLLHINTHLHRIESHPCWLVSMYLSASPSCSKNYLSQNGSQRVFLCWLPPLDSLSQTSVCDGSTLPKEKYHLFCESNGLHLSFMKELFGSQLLQFAQMHCSSTTCHENVHKAMKLKAENKAWDTHASSCSGH